MPHPRLKLAKEREKTISAPEVIRQLLEWMLALHKSLSAARNPSEQDRLKREIESTDGEIDRLVYALYGLSEEEVKIVEG
ncbi:MAG: hypothetical protein ACOYZ6_08255 [Chloroflexota bacterium]